MKQVPCVVLALVLFISLGATSAFASSAHSNGVNVLLNVTSWVITVPYGATKVAYAGLGTVVGALGYILTLGSDEPAYSVWRASLLGTYVLTPDHLTGDEPIRFVGP